MTTCPWYADVQARWKQLADCANGIIPTKLPVSPVPGEIRALEDDLLTLARHVDGLIASYGQYLAAHASGKVDQSVFTDQLRGALDGNATFEISEVADRLREDMLEAV